MTVQSIQNPLPYFRGLDGQPLTGGYVYIGQPGQDPRSYPASVYFDRDLTIPAPQPLRTSGGYIVRNGAPATVWIDGGPMSMLVLDSAQRQVSYTMEFIGVLPAELQNTYTVDRFSGDGATTAFTLSVTPASENDTMVYVSGVYVQKNAYSLAGAVLTFAAAPALGTNNIEIISATFQDWQSLAADVEALLPYAAAIDTVAGISADVTAVAGIAADVTTVVGLAAEVTTVAGISADVTAVGGNIANVNAVAANATNINAVAGNASNIDAVAGVSADVTTVAGISADVTAVAADQANIDAVAANLTTLDQALTASATAGVYSNGAASNVPRGLTQASVGAITAGSGGTSGTFALAWSGGNFTVNPTGTFTVSGGALTAVTITGPGLYIGASPTVPTPSFAASSGLTGAAVALTAQFLVTSGSGYWVTSSSGLTLDHYRNSSGTATSNVANVPSIATSTSLYQKRLTAQVNDAYADYFEYLNTASQTVTNITDGAAITNTRTLTATGEQIVISTGSRDVLFSTLLTTGSAKKLQLDYRAAVTTVGTACRVGLLLTSTSDASANRSNFWYANNGTININGVSVSTTAPTYTSGDTIDMRLVIDPAAGSVYGWVKKNSGAPYCFGVSSGVYMGYVFLFQRGTSTVTHAITVESEGSLTEGRMRKHDDVDVLSDSDRDNLASFSSWANDYLRSQPSGLTFTLPRAIKVYKRDTGRNFFGSLNLRPLLSQYDPEVTTLYVDLATGNDSTGTGTSALPLKTPGAASARILAGSKVRLLIKGGLYDFAQSFTFFPGTFSMLDIIAYGASPVIISAHDAGLTWTLSAGTTYSATFADSVTSVWDAKTANLTSDGDYARLSLAASQAACESTPGSYYISGTTIYVNTIDGRSPDSDIRVMKYTVSRKANLSAVGQTGSSVYVENINFEGGNLYGMSSNFTNTTSTMTVYRRGCSAKYTGDDGFLTTGVIACYSQECIAAWTGNDGYHYNPYTTSTGHVAVEWDCIARWCGTNGGGTANSSSNHGGTTIRVKTRSGYGDYHHSQDRGIHDIAQNVISTSWHLGITSRDSRNSRANFAVGLAADPSYACKMWLDYCDSSGATYDIEAATGSTAYTNQFTGTSSNAGGGTVTTYTP